MIVIVIKLMIIYNCALGPRHLTNVIFNTDDEDHKEDCWDCNCAPGNDRRPRSLPVGARGARVLITSEISLALISNCRKTSFDELSKK